MRKSLKQVPARAHPCVIVLRARGTCTHRTDAINARVATLLNKEDSQALLEAL